MIPRRARIPREAAAMPGLQTVGPSAHGRLRQCPPTRRQCMLLDVSLVLMWSALSCVCPSARAAAKRSDDSPPATRLLASVPLRAAVTGQKKQTGAASSTSGPGKPRERAPPEPSAGGAGAQPARPRSRTPPRRAVTPPRLPETPGPQAVPSLGPAACELLREAGFRPDGSRLPAPVPPASTGASPRSSGPGSPASGISVGSSASRDPHFPFSHDVVVAVALASTGQVERLCGQLTALGGLCRRMRAENGLLHGVVQRIRKAAADRQAAAARVLAQSERDLRGAVGEAAELRKRLGRAEEEARAARAEAYKAHASAVAAAEAASIAGIAVDPPPLPSFELLGVATEGSGSDAGASLVERSRFSSVETDSAGRAPERTASETAAIDQAIRSARRSPAGGRRLSPGAGAAASPSSSPRRRGARGSPAPGHVRGLSPRGSTRLRSGRLSSPVGALRDVSPAAGPLPGPGRGPNRRRGGGQAWRERGGEGAEASPAPGSGQLRQRSVSPRTQPSARSGRHPESPRLGRAGGAARGAGMRQPRGGQGRRLQRGERPGVAPGSGRPPAPPALSPSGIDHDLLARARTTVGAGTAPRAAAAAAAAAAAVGAGTASNGPRGGRGQGGRGPRSALPVPRRGDRPLGYRPYKGPVGSKPSALAAAATRRLRPAAGASGDGRAQQRSRGRTPGSRTEPSPGPGGAARAAGGSSGRGASTGGLSDRHEPLGMPPPPALSAFSQGRGV